MDNLKRKLNEHLDSPEISIKRHRHHSNEDVAQNYNQIINVFQNEFQKEIHSKREEFHTIQQQLLKVQKTLHLLKYVVVKSFYESKDLKVNANEIPVLPSTCVDPNAVLNQENRIHPAIKKLIGKKPINYAPYRTRKKGNTKHTIKIEENITIKEEIEETDNINNTLLYESDKVIPNISAKQEKEDNRMPVRNRNKSKYTILVGNISKWMPSNNSQDNSTHKWMVYVRGPKANPDITHIVQKVRFFLHPSYQPNDIVDVQEGPFHLSRRGWGEFPIRVQIYFKNNKNKPIDIIHNIKLDRTYTGRQTMGGETLVDVWLYDKDFTDENDIETEIEDKSKLNQELIKKELSRDNFDFNYGNKLTSPTISSNKIVEDTIKKCHIGDCDIIYNFIENCIENITVLEKIEKQNKLIYEDNCDNEENKISLSSILCFEDSIANVSNSLLNKFDTNQMSLLNSIGLNKYSPPTIDYKQNNIYEDNYEYRDINRIYLEDHCYTKLTDQNPKENEEIQKKSKYVIGKNNIEEVQTNLERDKYKISVSLECFSSISQIVFYLFKHMPLVTELANDTNYICVHPYTAATLEQYLEWNSAKQFCAEWYRAKQIKQYFLDNKLIGQEQWPVKVILQFGHAHGFGILRRYELFSRKTSESGKTIPNKRVQSSLIKNTLTEIVPYRELLDFKSTVRNNDNCDIDILETKKEQKKNISHKNNDQIQLIQDNQPALDYVKHTAKQIGVDLEPEEITDNIYDRVSESVVLKSAMCLAEELIRKALANNIIEKRIKQDEKISKADVLNVLLERKEFSMFLNVGLGKNATI